MFSKAVRRLTVVPVTTLGTLLLLYCHAPTAFPSVGEGCLIGFLLCVLPLTAYPLQPLFPKFRPRGRKGQRELAFVFALAGYLLALVFCLAFRLNRNLLRFVLVYLFSALLLMLFNFGFHVHASAHASGVTASALILTHALGPSVAQTLSLSALLLLVWQASLSTHRHKAHELLLGSLLPLLAFQGAQLVS